MTDEPKTPAQRRAFKQGQVAFLEGESAVDNPHMTDVAFTFWRRGFLFEKRAAEGPTCAFCGKPTDPEGGK